MINFNRGFPKLQMEHLTGSCTEPFNWHSHIWSSNSALNIAAFLSCIHQKCQRCSSRRRQVHYRPTTVTCETKLFNIIANSCNQTTYSVKCMQCLSLSSAAQNIHNMSLTTWTGQKKVCPGLNTSPRTQLL